MGPADFEDLCRQHYPGVARLAYLITGDRQEAVDLAQEAFARAFERWGRVSRLERPEAWVQRVAANLAVSWRRQAGRILPMVSLPEGSVNPPDLPDPEVAEALGALTPAQRAVIVLRFFLDWSVAQVADALGKGEGTVRALTSQGMVRLRRSLSTQEVRDEARG